ncbi:AAA family ATPase, partial [Streptomyces sp. PSKA30]|nr:AAA family ATPase [Streptomyces sp. PSKA30]
GAGVAAVRGEPSRTRWEGGWGGCARAVDAGVPDVAARAARDLAAMREPDWPIPPGIDAFLELLQLAGALPGAR